MAHFRIGSLASLLVFGGTSIAAAQSPAFLKTSETINDTGKGVAYSPNTSYVAGQGFFGTTITCCPNLGGNITECDFTVTNAAGSKLTASAILGVPQTQIISRQTLTFQGPSQWTVTLVGTCYFENGGHLYLPRDFITSYSLIVEKPNSN